MTNEYSFNFAFTPGLPGIVNMEIDRRLSSVSVPAARTVRFFTWRSNTISIGCNQDRRKRIDLELCSQDGIDAVRRPTGGRELLHGHDLCYSVVWPTPDALTAIEAGDIFARINDILISALRRLNVQASWQRSSGRRGGASGPCFALVDRGEVSIDGKKLMASAQRIFEKAVLQQGSMPLMAPVVDIARYLRSDDGTEMRKKLARTATCLYDHINETISVSSIVEMFKGDFERFLGSEADALRWDLDNMGLMPVN